MWSPSSVFREGAEGVANVYLRNSSPEGFNASPEINFQLPGKFFCEPPQLVWCFSTIIILYIGVIFIKIGISTTYLQVIDVSQNKQHPIIGNLKINWNHKTIFQTHNFICFLAKRLFCSVFVQWFRVLSAGCTSINSSINRTLNKILQRLRACEQSKFSLAIISQWFIDAKLESDAAFLRRDASQDAPCSQRYVR